MNNIRPGLVVKSKTGRDKNKFFIVLAYESPYLYLVDGKLRRLDNPKKKKEKHIQLTNYVDYDLGDVILNESKLNNADIRKSLESYYNLNEKL